jgi:hypothetical protein
MKLNIITQDSQRIDNYNNVSVINGEVNFLDVSDGECEEVLISDCSSLSVNSISTCMKKVSINGKIKLQGVDLRLLCRQTINQMIPEEDASRIIETSKTIIPMTNLARMVSASGFEIDSANINGVRYQVWATRK